MDAQNFLAAAQFRDGDCHMAIEASGPQQRGIQDVGAVRCGDQNYAFLRVKAVHLDQQLIKRLLTLVMSAADAGETMTADGVDFIHEQEARRVLAPLVEEVANATCSDADEHFNELAPGGGEERHAGFASN